MEEKSKKINRIIGIDASNLRQGGGLTHLIELISVINPSIHEFEKLVIWSRSETLDCLEDQSWLKKITTNDIEQGLFSRFFWQRFKLIKAAEAEDCNLIFVPGGSFSC